MSTGWLSAALGGGSHLPLRPWQRLSEVMPISEGLQYRQEVPVANGGPESLRLGCGPPGKPMFHILGHDVVPAGAPAKDNRSISEQTLFPPTDPGTTPQEVQVFSPEPVLDSSRSESPHTSGPGSF